MAVKTPICVYSVFVLLIVGLLRKSSAIYSIEFQSVSDCKTGTGDLYHQFFDYTQLQCQNCFQNSTFQTVSTDGLSCVCQSGYYLTENYGGAKITCQKCAVGKVTSENPWECVECQTIASPPVNACPACATTNQVTVERLLNGSYPVPAYPSRTCETCATQTYPNADNTQCVRCNQILSVIGANNCECPPNQFTGGVCFQSADDINFQGSNLYTVTFDATTVESAYFEANLRAAAGMCLPTYSNLTACELLGNLCNLIFYTRVNEGKNTDQDACSIYLQIGSQQEAGANNQDWPPNMPWLYYLDETADQVLTDTGLSTEFTFPNMELPIQVAKYMLNGTFMGYFPVTNGEIQLCPNQDSILNAAWRFGTKYYQSCEIPVSSFWDTAAESLYFYDMWMEFGTDNSELYAIPVLVTNYVSQANTNPNQGSDQTKWQLVRRFFLVDNVSGKPVSSTGGTSSTTQELQAVHFAQSMILHISLQTNPVSGKIYPPYLEITYGVASLQDYQNNGNVQVSFEVQYDMDQSKQQSDVSIAAGVISAFAIIYAGFQSWVWNRRAGKISIDFFTLIKFFLFSCNNLANTFFVVIFGYALWMLIFYKRQSTVALIPPDSSQTSQFLGFLITAFVLKFIALAHMMYIQCKVDIFFIDWERPHGKVAASNDKAQQGKEAPVSIWRTYFVANEWNEIQSCRKINNIFQIFAVIFFLQVLGLGNMATQEPRTSLNPGSNVYVSPYNPVFRFAAGGLVYLVVAIVQWLFYVLIYERFSADKLKNYVDLCSMSNVSVFILENEQFGYYIHGRSPHGQADTGLRQMAENLKREENSLCAERGLVPNTDQQTFQILVQPQLRVQYDKVIKPITQPAQGAAGAVRGQGPGGKQSSLSDLQEKSIAAYGMLNRFLQNFIDHSLRTIDYVIKDKVLFENILNAEFQDIRESSVFYNDGGKSFGAILFMGNETTLTLFEILFFSVMDLAFQNYVLSAILVYILMLLVTALRDGLGEQNLAQKTLVDKRFLI